MMHSIRRMVPEVVVTELVMQQLHHRETVSVTARQPHSAVTAGSSYCPPASYWQWLLSMHVLSQYMMIMAYSQLLTHADDC